MEQVNCPNCEASLNFEKGVPNGNVVCPNCHSPFCATCVI